MKFTTSALALLTETASQAASQPAVQQAFVWSEHIGDIIKVSLLSLVPTFEGRYAINAGQLLGMPLLFTFLLAFVMSSIPMPFIFWLLRPILKWLYTLPIKPLQRFAAWVENRASKKSKGMEAGSLLALFAFVALPLPGTGVWTGSAIATMLEMDKRKAAIAILLGNLAACTIMALVGTGVGALLKLI